MKGRKKIADRTRHSKNCNLFADVRFCKRGSEAKNARGCSHRLFLEGARSGHIAKRTSNGATRANENYTNGFHKRRLGVKKVILFVRRWSKSFFRNVLPTEGAEHIFAKKWKNKWCNAKMHAKCVLQLTFSMQIGSDPILDGSICKSKMFCRVDLHA